VIVRKHRLEYTSGKRSQKQRLGQKILDEIHRKGGRFLKQQDPYRRGFAWFEVSEEVSLAKVKQALREHRNDGWWTEESDEGENKKSSLSPKKRHSVAASKPLMSGSDGVVDCAAGFECQQYSTDTVVTVTHMRSSTNTSMMEVTDAHSSVTDARKCSTPTANHLGVVMGTVVTPPQHGVARNGPKSPNMLPPILLPLVPPISDRNAGLSSLILSPLVPAFPVESTGLGAVDTRLLLYRDLEFGAQGQAVIPQPIEMIPGAQPSPFTAFSNSWDCTGCMGKGLWQNVENTRKNAIVSSHRRGAEDNSINSLLRDFSRFRTNGAGAVDAKRTYRNLDSTSTVPVDSPNKKKELEAIEVEESPLTPPGEGSSTSIATEDDVAAFLLSSLTLVDRPVVTEEQEAMERNTLTIQEKAAILTDALGMASARGIHRNKKARTDLDRRSTAFLVRLMKAEIEKIPVHERQALVEAQMKCGISEFSDARLEQFLRCEGMNAKVRTARCQGAPSACKRQELICVCSRKLVAGSSPLCKLLGKPPPRVWAKEVSDENDFERSLAGRLGSS